MSKTNSIDAAPSTSPFSSERFKTRVAENFASQPGANVLRDPEATLALLTAGEARPGGRSEHRLLPGSDWGRPLRLRPARRGGALAPLLGDRFLQPDRILREFDLTLALRRTGVPVVEPAFAFGHRRGVFWRAAFASVDEPASFDGRALFEGAPTDARLRAAATAAGKALRALHDAGVLHGDLHLRNLLFSSAAGAGTKDDEQEDLRCQLIDLDRARQVASPSPSARMHEWMRLLRSLEKNGLTQRITPRTYAAALSAYCQRDRDLRRAMWACLAQERARALRHRLGWRIGRRLRLAAPLLASFALATLFAMGGCSSEDAVGPPPEHARFSLFALGDTGRTRPLAALTEGQLAVAAGMVEEASERPITGVVLLGDNFYTDGLDRDTLVPRVRENLVRPYCAMLRLDGPRSSEVESACSTPRSERRPVPFYAVLGNHDLELPGSASLQREAVPAFVPEWRMAHGLAESIELGHGVSLILFESEPEIDDRAAIIHALRSAIRAAKGPWRILATHRPIATDDLGTPWLGGYPSFVRDAITAEGLPVQLVLAGHHHSLQAFEVETPRLLQLGLGSGSRAEGPLASPDHPDLRFSRKALGFARIDLVGTGTEERMVTTLMQTSSWPALSALQSPRAVARFAIDLTGSVVPTSD